MKVSRNDPCPCGSGRKYKKCCLREDARRAAPDPQHERDDLSRQHRLPDAGAELLSVAHAVRAVGTLQQLRLPVVSRQTSRNTAFRRSACVGAHARERCTE